jgi:hypothetical protein
MAKAALESSMPAPEMEEAEYMPTTVTPTTKERKRMAKRVEERETLETVRERRRRKQPRKRQTPKSMSGEAHKRKAARQTWTPSTWYTPEFHSWCAQLA